MNSTFGGIPLPVNATQNSTPSKILCCQCGLLIEPNPLNTCVQCIQSKIDITDELSKQCLIQFCSKCERYLQPPTSWIKATLESRQLLGLCLKRVKGLNKLHLVDAGFVWTEPHSKRLKVKVSVQKDVSGALLQQTTVIEFQIVNQICDDCQRVEAKDYWKCVVQVRQRATHKKTFFYLEQLILKLNAHQKTVSIKQTPDGIDFFYALNPDAQRLVDFLMGVAPCRFSTSKRLISHDIHSNTYNYKFTFCVEIAPICKDDIVCLPPKLSKDNGSIGPICICYRVTQLIHLIDPKTLKVIEINPDTYWRYPFHAISHPKQLKEFIVMDIEKDDAMKPHVFGKESHKHQLGDAWVLKASEMTSNTQPVHTKTHLGHLLNIGDSALGFDFANANINDENLDAVKEEKRPDVILVKKLYGDRQKRHKKRNWKLNRLNIDKDGASVASSQDKDYLDFLEDLEEDPKARENINIYKDPKKMMAVEADMNDNDNMPQISLQEMLDDMCIQDDPMGDS